MRPADYRFYPMDFPSPLETDSATGGTIAYVDWQKGRKNFWKTGKNAKKLCKRTENTCKLGVYYCIIILKIGELYPQKRERFFGEKNKPGAFARGGVHGKTKENFKEQAAEDSGLSFCGVYCVFHCCAAVGNSRSENNAGGSAAAVSTANRRKQRGRAVVAMSADKDYIERIARERLGYAYPDEKVYIDSSKN